MKQGIFSCVLLSVVFTMSLVQGAGYVCVAAEQPRGEAIVIAPLPRDIQDLLERLQLPNPEQVTAAQRQDRQQWVEFARRFVARATSVLDDDVLPADERFRMYFYYVLGTSSMYLDDWNNAQRFLKSGLEYISSAGREMRGIAASLRLTFINVCFESGDYASAYPHVKALIEEGEGLGSGDMRNFVAAREVSEHYRLVARARGMDEDHIIHYLKALSDRHNNEIGCAADAELLKLAVERKDRREITRLKERLSSRYPKTPQFTSLYENVISEK